MKLLEGINIVDFSARLPGPLSTKVLSDLGAKITKVESTAKEDPFLEADLNAISPAFKDWYQNLNHNKKIIQLDFNEQMDEIKNLTKNADAVLVPDHPFYEKLLANCQIKVLIKIAGGKGQYKSLHDLNAMGMTKTFRLHLNQSPTPPYLPFAGINLGLVLSSTITSGIICYLKTGGPITQTVYLKDSTEKIFDCFDSQSFKNTPKQLHNGALPCYNIYATKDHKWVCLAAAESKYWDKFIQIFDFPLKPSDRYDKSGKSFEIIQKKFASMDLGEIQSEAKDLDICLTLID